ncbi:MAG: hypothetical protein HY043_06650 [Verrucomicrobia bacterium]|nr:hypothetical protein [Verrucomicrobiota bacterium]
MNILDKEFKLQALLDGELSPDEARQVTEWLAGDAAAKALFAELKATKAAIAGNEQEIRLSESREFYWSKIARQIEREDAVAVGDPRKTPFAWMRWFAPLAGTATLVIVLALALRLRPGLRSGGLASADAFEPPHEDSSIISFHSDSEGISVVWVATR